MPRRRPSSAANNFNNRRSIFFRAPSNLIMKAIRLLLAFLVTALPFAAPAAGLIIAHDPDQPDQPLLMPRLPEPRPPGHRPQVQSAALEMTRHQVQVKINDQLAVTEIEQAFHNPLNRRLEGTFLFPVPDGATLRKFTMEIDGKPVEAELLAAEEARKIYEDIVRRQRDPALFEFLGRSLYKFRIFPIEPNSTRTVRFSYEQLLKSDLGLIGYTYPMSVERFCPQPVKKLALSVELNSSQDLKSIYSPTHELEIRRDGGKRATIGYESTDDVAQSDLQLFFSRDREEVGMSLLTHRGDVDEDGYFLLLASPGLVDERGEVMAKDVVFVLDSSGSMAGNKLEQAKKALEFCVANLNERDRFEVLRFSTETETVFQGMVAATADHRDKATRFIRGLKPLGGTAINDALKEALALRSEGDERPFVVIFLTDGLPTVGETNIDRIVANVSAETGGSTRIFSFGIGHDVNTHLLDRITESTRAYSQYVLPDEDIEVKVSNFFSRIKDPVLAGPTFAISERIGANRLYPHPLPDLFNGDQLVLVGRYETPGSASGTLTGKVAKETRTHVYDLNFAEQSTEHDFIPRLWANRRIGWLLDQIRLNGESKELKDEVAQLAREHGIVTPYTAWLIVEDEERRNVTQSVRSVQLNEQNRLALNYSRDSVEQLGKQQSGAASVLSARSNQEARYSSVASQSAPSRTAEALDQDYLSRYGDLFQAEPSRVAGQPAPTVQVKPSELVNQAQSVAGKTFYWDGEAWVDSAIQANEKAEVQTITFNSEDYFELVKSQPKVAPWLAVGSQVRFFHNGQIYEIED